MSNIDVVNQWRESFGQPFVTEIETVGDTGFDVAFKLESDPTWLQLYAEEVIIDNDELEQGFTGQVRIVRVTLKESGDGTQWYEIALTTGSVYAPEDDFILNVKDEQYDYHEYKVTYKEDEVKFIRFFEDEDRAREVARSMGGHTQEV